MSERFDTDKLKAVAVVAEKFNAFQSCSDAAVIGATVFIRVESGSAGIASVQFALSEAGMGALKNLLNIYSSGLRETVIASGLTPTNA